MDSTFIEKLRQHFDNMSVTQKNIAETLGVDPAYINKLLSGKKGFGKKTAQQFQDLYGLSASWLLTGEGNMLKDGSDMPHADSSLGDSSSELYYTYLIPMSAMAGSLTGFDTEGVCPRECERIVSPIAGVDFAISVYGDSMVPEFPSGSRVLLKRINHTIYIEWGNVFVLDTTNGIILKEVQPSAKEGILTCHSLNPNGRYKDFDVPMCEIRAMYKVLACVSMR